MFSFAKKEVEMKLILTALLVTIMISTLVEMSLRSSVMRAQPTDSYHLQERPSPTPIPTATPSPSPSPSGTATPVPEPEPVPSRSPTPSINFN
jgi:hypothetical protein